MSFVSRIVQPTLSRYRIIGHRCRTYIRNKKKLFHDTKHAFLINDSYITGTAVYHFVPSSSTSSRIEGLGRSCFSKDRVASFPAFSYRSSGQINQQRRSFSTATVERQYQKFKTANRKSKRVEGQHSQRSRTSGFKGKVRQTTPSIVTSMLIEDARKSTGEHDSITSYQETCHEIEDLLDSAGLDEDQEFTESESDFSDDDRYGKEFDDQDGMALGEEDYFEKVEVDLGYDREKSEDKTNDSVFTERGVPNPNLPMSDVPCSGCGALLHCQDTGIPGYMPSQVFQATPKHKLREKICQRCVLLQRHNLALKASVTPEEYRDIIKQIKDVRALVIVVVDVMDMPNSIFPNLSELIGKKRPLYIVGNKADLVPQDSVGYLKRLKDMIFEQCEEYGLTSSNYIKHVSLISAKTGYGIEELATKLLQDWGRKGHIYILGCTNVGKSSLFNALLSSDMCNESAADFMNKATTSTWPGTTLNLLKFPLINPEPWKLARRAKRLKLQMSEEAEERKFLRAKHKEGGKYPTIMGHISRTFEGYKNIAVDDEDSKGFSGASFSFNDKTGLIERNTLDKEKLQGYTYDETVYEKSRWCHDTPGVVNPAQIINELTQHELSVLLTDKFVTPRSFILKPGQSMHVSGLGRIDLTQAERSVLFTVFTARRIPVNVRDTKDIDDFYKRNIGTRVMGIPLGDAERINRLPPLVGKEMTLYGKTWKESVADIVLSSIGWVAVTPGPDVTAELIAYTPGGQGCVLRKPALLPYAVNLRGKRCRSAAYKIQPTKVFL